MKLNAIRRHGSLFGAVALVFLLSSTSLLAADKKKKSQAPLSDELELPPTVMEPEPVFDEKGADVTAPLPMDDTPLTLPPSKTEEPSPAAQASSPKSSDEIDDVLENPSRSIEEYERVRKDRLHQTTIMKYSFNLTLEPRAFSQIDLRAPTKAGFDQINPGLLGIMFGYDHSILRKGGITMLGLEGGIYASTQNDPYSGLMFGFMSLHPNIRYEAAYLPKQWVVPTVGAGMEFLRYAYTFQNKHIGGFKTMPRFDIGALIFLNLLEPTSAADMESNWGVKKTYLSLCYSVSNDTGKRDFNMSDSQWRFGFRFEH